MSHICPQFSYIFFPWDFMALCLFCFDSKFMIQFLIFIMFSISPIVKHSLLERPSGFWKYRCTFVAVTMESDSPFLFYIWFFFKYILLAMYSDDNPKYIIEWNLTSLSEVLSSLLGGLISLKNSFTEIPNVDSDVVDLLIQKVRSRHHFGTVFQSLGRTILNPFKKVLRYSH